MFLKLYEAMFAALKLIAEQQQWKPVTMIELGLFTNAKFQPAIMAHLI